MHKIMPLYFFVDTYTYQRDRCAHAALPNDYAPVVFPNVSHELKIAEYSPTMSLEKKR